MRHVILPVSAYILFIIILRTLIAIGVLLTASPWIILAVVCTCVTLYYLMLPHQPVDDSVHDIGVSLNALSLEWRNDHNNSIQSNISWFSELNKLDLLTANSSLPVTMDITSKQIISPPKLKLHPTSSCKTNPWNRRMSEDSQCVNNKQHYIIITLSSLLLLSVMCNVVLIYWIT